jgi:hypothetical protein
MAQMTPDGAVALAAKRRPVPTFDLLRLRRGDPDLICAHLRHLRIENGGAVAPNSQVVWGGASARSSKEPWLEA